jgi:hypothetical protein
MKTDRFLSELEKIVEELGYSFRREKGNFKGDFCVLEGDKIVMVNKMYPAEVHVGQIVRFLMKQNLEDRYIKPAVRKELDAWYDRIAKQEQATQ